MVVFRAKASSIVKFVTCQVGPLLTYVHNIDIKQDIDIWNCFLRN